MNPSLRLRAAILLPAIVVMIVMAVLAVVLPDLSGPLTRSIPFVFIAAVGPAMMLALMTERQNTRSGEGLDRGAVRLRRLFGGLLVVNLVFIVGMAVWAFTQPRDVAVWASAVTAGVTIVVAGAAFVWHSRTARRKPSTG